MLFPTMSGPPSVGARTEPPAWATPAALWGRQRMVDQQVAARGVRDARVLRAMVAVPRELFVSAELQARAFEDTPLPIGIGQTISQPFVVALMVEALRLAGDERVLEVGAGSGYAAAVLGELAAEVYAVERHHSLAVQASDRLAAAGYRNVHVVHGDGTLGWPPAAPYGAILVSAAAPSVPPPLLAQLLSGGWLVIPVAEPGDTTRQELWRIQRLDAVRCADERLGPVRFVPLVAASGANLEPLQKVSPRRSG
jgi:protein-L-isoaspartate(D-aspartate) O-methyltransferase